MAPSLRYVLLIGLLCASAASPTVAQSLDRGTLLVATPALAGTSFEDTVLLVLHHDDDGALALMINRPTSLGPGDVFNEASPFPDYAGPVFFGGPITPTRGYLLLRRNERLSESNVEIVRGVFLSGDFQNLADLPADQRNNGRIRFYAGHAQWGPGQLDAEVAAGAWEILRGRAEWIFSSDPLALWRELQAVDTRGGEIARLAR
jgi:putative transcriptional regulator